MLALRMVVVTLALAMVAVLVLALVAHAADRARRSRDGTQPRS